MAGTVALCLNCLTTGAGPCAVGPEQGSQRDPYHATIALCTDCRTLLIAGNLPAFNARYLKERLVTREDIS